MKQPSVTQQLHTVLEQFSNRRMTPLDLIASESTVEKFIELAINGAPNLPVPMVNALDELKGILRHFDTSGIRLVVLGGGTGLSNIVGGDSRKSDWYREPFSGLKTVFPELSSIVCTSDDGGSTGELRKELPIIALGDIRHVLLSSIRGDLLRSSYALSEAESVQTAESLHRLFNYRSANFSQGYKQLLQAIDPGRNFLPEPLADYLKGLVDLLYSDANLKRHLNKSHCLGNLLLAALYHDDLREEELSGDHFVANLREMAEKIGAGSNSALPCTLTPAQLKVLYSNGVMVTGEYKSGTAHRGYPMDRVFVEFAAPPRVPEKVLQCIAEADILLFAPGSLYTSIIPILQVPAICQAVKDNRQALKILIANLWIQKGETDLVREAPERKYYVSDLIKAYHRNIPEGIAGIVDQVLVLALDDIPGSILRNYALENKIPIYVDRQVVNQLGFELLEANIYSQKALATRKVIQHDPDSLAIAVKTIWAAKSFLNGRLQQIQLPPAANWPALLTIPGPPSQRMAKIRRNIAEKNIPPAILPILDEIFWEHKDIPVDHLQFFKEIVLIESLSWQRNQKWDNIFSFYDPGSQSIKIRDDMAPEKNQFEVAFLIALGQSLLGNYAQKKEMTPIHSDGEQVGSLYRLTLRREEDRVGYFNSTDLAHYLNLARMVPCSANTCRHTRTVNGREGFTPPGLLFGLSYAWYLDNRFAAHIEYKMAITRNAVSELIPEQVKMLNRRQDLVDFFRTTVFQHDFQTA